MANRQVFTPENKARFVEELRTTCNVSAAARAIGASRRYAYRVREADPEFAEAWDDAIEEALDKLEREVQRRGFEGVEEPVFYQGEECGYIRRYSDGLALKFLQAHREKWRDKSDVSVQVKGDIAHRIINARKRVGS